MVWSSERRNFTLITVTIFEQASFDSLMITGDITAIAQIRDKIWFTSSSDGAIHG